MIVHDFSGVRVHPGADALLGRRRRPDGLAVEAAPRTAADVAFELMLRAQAPALGFTRGRRALMRSVLREAF